MRSGIHGRNAVSIPDTHHMSVTGLLTGRKKLFLVHVGLSHQGPAVLARKAYCSCICGHVIRMARSKIFTEDRGTSSRNLSDFGIEVGRFVTVCREGDRIMMEKESDLYGWDIVPPA